MPVDLIPESTHKTPHQTHSKFVDVWRNHMSKTYKIASTNSSCKKHKDMARHGNRGPLTAVLEKGDWVLIRNLLERGLLEI